MGSTNQSNRHLQLVSTVTTTPDQIAKHLQQSDSVGQIKQALETIGIESAKAHEEAIGCVQRCNPELLPIIAWACAEAVWRKSEGDEWATRSLAAYALRGNFERDRAAKIYHDVLYVLQEANRHYTGRATPSERVRAATHLGDFKATLAKHATTLQQKANALVARMRRDVGGTFIERDGH